ncbi:hypothetical protein QWZ16_24865 [Vibrio ostreicida]|uniref:TM2 domain-containing protein n=1 Tax=Vibrio ostreicida TaxID=526588 RepID=A0ABT8C0I4_9VIBR|nr:hypothetical protein [Vibrio ostreicida]MDN3612783.1 hypothetical protein [Vibrio ostreicida]
MKIFESLDEIEQKENVLRQQVNALPEKQKMAYFSRQSKKIKDPDTYAALNWFFFGGFHHCYLGKYTLFLIEFFLLILGIVGLANGHYSAGLILAAIALYELPQLFFAQKIARQHNYQLSCEVLTR